MAKQGDKRPRLQRPAVLASVTDAIESKIDYTTGDDEHPVFCLRYVHPDFAVKSKGLTAQDRSQMLVRLEALSTLTWGEIKAQDRHRYGTEFISVAALRPNLPQVMPGDAQERDSYERVWVFRRNSKKNVFAGFRVGKTFHIVYVEANFGDLYDH